MDRFQSSARQVIERCSALSLCSEEPGFTTRTFLSEPMRTVHQKLIAWMEHAGMQVSVDAAGNLRGRYAAGRAGARRFYIGSHLDTVPHAGAFDGILGVVLAVELVALLNRRALPFHIEVVGFSEEEGVRFGVPFIGSRALIGDITEELLDAPDREGISVREAIRRFGLDPARLPQTRADEDALGYFEFHIEQGPVLEELNLRVGVVESIAGQSRVEVAFEGQASHAGTTPMHLRRDALAGAAEWVGSVEREAKTIPGLVATIGKMSVQPCAANVIPGQAHVTLDIRHANDSVRVQARERLLGCARQTAVRRNLGIQIEPLLDQPAVALDTDLVALTEQSVAGAGYPVYRMSSGAGHDAMIMARLMPAAMLFLRSPGGISHHPSEAVLPEDVAAALRVGEAFVNELELRHG